MLNIAARWSHPIELLDGSKQNAIYRVADISRVPQVAGVYVFARRYGETVVPVYIGETTDLRKRLEQHLDNVRIMKGIENQPSGARLYLYARVQFKPGQRQKKVLDILQKALIEHALSAGHDLLNIQLTRIKVHTIFFEGNRLSEQLFTRRMLISGH